jgi:flagellar hook-associated protein 3 FlgL
MRISTSGMFDTSASTMNSLQSQLSKTQMQLSLQKRILTPSDDPVASARVLEVTQSQEMNTQFGTNRTNARSSLQQVDGALTSVGKLMTDVKTLIVRAGNPGLSQADRESIATELDGRLTDLVGLANTTDGAGTYLFSGYKTGTQPFTQTPGGATYAGDQGQRELQVGASRKMATSDSGSAIFENNKAAAGTFHVAVPAANTGSGTITSAVMDPTKLTGHDYAINFTVDALGATTYDVIDKNLAAPGTVLSGQPYVDGAPISFDGLQFNVSGTPASGDQFNVDAAKKQSVFTTLSDLVQLLRSPPANAAAQANLSNGLGLANSNVSTALDTVLSVQSSVGSRLQELDTLDDAGGTLDLQYSSTLSDLQDLDMVKAISLFSQQQMALDAAQKSFKTVSGLSLFNYIG